MTREEIIQPENLVYGKNQLVNDTPMHYCPGCSHGVVHKLVAEVIDEMGLAEKTIGVCPVGCAVFAYRYLDIAWQERTCACGGDCMQTPLAGQTGFHIPRGWRFGLHWCGGNHTRLKSWRENNDYLHKQCNIWNDRRANGSDNTGRNENFNLPLRKGRELARLSA